MGATGYLGSLLVPALLDAGHEVSALVRAPDASDPLPAPVTVHAGDATDPRAVREALAGVEVAYFLVHSLERDDFADVDRRAATVLVEGAAAAGVRQVVYVGGPRPTSDDVSEHLASRAEVGDILTAGSVPALALQASMIIGRGSTSFDLLATARLSPWVPVPRWMRNTSRPVAAADVVHYLLAAAEVEPPVRGTFDVPGPEALSYLALVQRYARVTGLRTRLPVPAPLWSHRLAAALTGVVTAIPSAVARPLFESLDHDLEPTDGVVTDVLPAPPRGPTTVDNAIRATFPATACRAATGAPFVDELVVPTTAGPDEVWRTITGLGGTTGWHTIPLVWTVRGAVDHLVGGVGLYRGRAPEVSDGDVVDFWTVLHRDDAARRLVLHADMRMPGDTVLEMSVEPGAYRQRITFTPDDVAGKLYWHLQKPLHDVVFTTMAHGIARGSTSTGRRAVAEALRDAANHVAGRLR
ncbi:DUF2867 domain-containing protein [Umezawaea sp.]|uniref:DUF2867 domain-containing protein n=1 Tax=Umezawaea sp. TaxID=1955258 RepID=UPI002ED0C7C4